MDLYFTATDNYQRVHPTPRSSHQGAMLSVSLVPWRGNGLRVAYSFFATSRARVIDSIPGEWNAFAHHPPVLPYTISYAYNLCLHSSETRPRVCTPLGRVSMARAYGQRE